jgi:tripartite-type tricarboxylate transporter receptor subunit TctC
MRNIQSQLLKTFAMLFVGFMVLTFTASIASPQTYPTKPVRLIISQPAGGSNDLVARMIATKLSERLGKQFVVDNRGGGGGILGTEMAAKAAPDGYTLFLASTSHTTTPALEKLPYDPIKSFTPIARLGSGPFLLLVHKTVPANSVKELIALAKQKPGKLIFGAGAVGVAPHLATELFKMMTGTDFKIVNFKGGGPALVDLLGGHSEALIGMIIQALPHIKSGQIRALGTGGTKPSVVLPDVPPVAETVPGFESTQWWGILGPAGTPAPIVDRLNNELKSILAADEVKKWFLNDGSEADYLGPTEFGPFIEKELAKWIRVVKEANIKLK